MNARSLAILILAVVGVTLISVTGCTDRDNPVEGGFTSDLSPYHASTAFSALTLNPLGDPVDRAMSVAWVSHTPPDQPQPAFPVLYLLHDFGGDDDYFMRYNLQATMDDMYERGEIGRMLVVTVGSNNSFGGSFYRNSPSTGRYANQIGEAITYIERTFRVYSDGGANARAISGHGMGGYGAMAYAIENPSMFGAVSAMSAPLAFDESWMSGVTEEIFAENTLPVGDSVAYSGLEPDPEKAITSLMFSMSAAFSPRNLEPFLELGVCSLCTNPLAGCPPARKSACTPCSVFASVLPGPTTFVFARATGNRPACSDPVLPAPLGVDLPFDWRKAINDSVLDLWLASDIRARFSSDPGVFGDMQLYFDCGVDDELGFLPQNRAFRDALQQAGMSQGTDFFYEEYSGYSALPAGHFELIAERLRKILKFHSDRFSRPPGSESN
jgi:S-formylglutathione hydrolase FrmB